jgi:hypothetical protein
VYNINRQKNYISKKIKTEVLIMGTFNEKAKELKDKAEEKTEELKHRAEEAGEKLKHKAEETAGELKHKVEENEDKTK